MKPPGAIFRIPSATYRWQFNREFPFQAGLEQLDYLDELGITDCYCSPIFTAPPESNHGYDVCDFGEVNPSLGGKEAWKDFVAALKQRGMGLLLDFVPNHMGAIPQINRWWTDVLEYGRCSPYAGFFDIDWQAEHLPVREKLLLPILPDHYGHALQRGVISLEFRDGRFLIGTGAAALPVCPTSVRRLWERLALNLPEELRGQLQEILRLLPIKLEYADRDKIGVAWERVRKLAPNETLARAVHRFLKEFNQSGHASALMHELLEEQPYRLVYWRSGTRIANYRRFFEVDSLVGLRMERSEVFQAVHELLLELVRSGDVTGLRLDHIDGLARPLAYLQELQAAIVKAKDPESTADGRPFYVLVEKITVAGEVLRDEWPVAGTTGYEFIREVTGLLVRKDAAGEFARIYQEFSGNARSPAATAHAAKKLVMGLALSKEVNLLARLLHRCAERRLHARDLLFDDLRAAIRETIACFPVYRTYRTAGTPASRVNAEIIRNAVTNARTANPELEPMAWNFLEEVLLADANAAPPPDETDEIFVQRFQQTTGGVMAKGYEDTMLFVSNRLNALNEVGGNPDQFGISMDEFHALNVARLESWPDTMLTTSTHDTKVSEDVRARWAALSELAPEWDTFLKEARGINEAHKTDVEGKLAPDGNEEYYLYEILLGTWPLQSASAAEKQAYLDRLKACATKALNEAKVNTRWDRRNAPWEQAVMNFLEKIVMSPFPEFTLAFEKLFRPVAEAGALNSLSQTLLKMTVPGVPDFYQGNELWHYLLVDPDNRCQIDYPKRRQMLRHVRQANPAELLSGWESGAIKMFLIQRALSFRRENRKVFTEGDYVPLSCCGQNADCCVAFARRSKGRNVVVLAPRWTRQLGFPATGERWKDTRLDVSGIFHREFTDVLTGRQQQAPSIRLADVLMELPFAILCGE